MIAELLANNKFDDARRLISEKLENNEITEQEYASYCVQISDAYNAYFFSNKETLENAKKRKIQESNDKLAQFLADNPFQFNGNTYNCTMEKQTQMALQYMTYTVEKTVNPNAKLTWNVSGETCEEISEQNFLTLMLGIKAYVYPIVEQQRQFEKDITECTTIEEVNAIEIIYEVPVSE